MQNRVVVIVGATGGIGSALTQKLIPMGCKLVLTAKHGDRLSALTNELPNANGKVAA